MKSVDPEDIKSPKVEKNKDIFTMTLKEFLGPALEKISETTVRYPLSANILTELGIYFGMLNLVLRKLGYTENIKGKIFFYYDQEYSEAGFEWVMNDRRFGVVCDDNSESSWFIIKSNGQSDSGNLVDLSNRQMEKTIRELLG